MMPAATHFDPVLGVDIHIVQPSGPVPPTPIPHPYVGIVFDPIDYLPILGSTVKVNGMHRAIAGTAGKALPKHFPIGGTFVPPLPADEHENFMGSSTVEMDGDAAAYLALPCLSCQSIGMPPPPRQSKTKKKKGTIESLVLPTSLVLAIPKGAPVLIGGTPTISLFSAAMHLMGPLAKAIRRSKAFRKGAAALKKARRRTFRNLKPGFLKCKVLRAEPVDVVTGEVVVDQQDFELPGRIPIRWTRHYRSGSTRKGVCGVGWETPADARLELAADGVVFHDGTGIASFFDALPEVEPVSEPIDGARLHRLDRHYAVELKGGLTYYFDVPPAPAAELPVAAIVDHCRNSLHFLRDADGLREVVESAGRRLVCTSEEGLLRSITLHHPDFPERRTLVRFAYDAAGNLTAVHDALDHPYSFGFDDRHRLVRHTNRTGLSFYYEYDAESRCVHSWGDGGLYDYHFDYNRAGCFTNLTDSLGHPWTVEYDERLLITRETDPLGGVTSYAYDEVGRTTAVIDPAGRMTGYDFDEQGNLLKLVRPDGTTIAIERDGDSQPVRITDPNGAVWEQSWDERGLPASRKSPLGAATLYGYDSSGRVTSVTDARGAVTSPCLDDFNNFVLVTDALGNATRFHYDPLGKISARIDVLGHTTAYCHDAKGRLVQVSLPDGAAIEFAYDADDNLIRFVDENGAVTRLEYIGLGEVKRRIQPDGNLVEYDYDREERLIKVINQRGEIYHLRRDPLGRIVEERDYWGQSRAYAYDAGGHIRSSTDPLGRVVHYATDPMGRVRRKAAPLHGQSEARFEECFDFDANGNLVRATNPHVIVVRRFDAEGKLLEEAQGGFTISNTYDPNGNRIRRETSTGDRVTYEYDSLDRVSAIRINDDLPILFERDRRGQISRETLGRELIRQYGYDTIGRQFGQAVTRDQQTILDVRFAYDPAGNLVERNDTHHGIDRLRYDLLGRVVKHTDPRGRLARFPHDPAGERLATSVRQEETQRSAIEFASQSNGWAREGELGGKRYRFDRAGNLVSRGEEANFNRPRKDAETTELVWDAQQRLRRSKCNGILTRYGYDALGRRVFKETNGKRTSFYWDGDALVGESVQSVQGTSTAGSGDASTTAGTSDPGSTEYLYYPETFEPLALIDRNGAHTRAYFYQTDPNGCPTRLVGLDGKAVWSAGIDASGGLAALHVSERPNPIRLQGQYEDSETSLHYNRYRYYCHSIGQFASQDPLRLRPSDNIYELAPNVFAWADPLGLARRPGHRTPFSWSRPSTGEWEIGDEFSGLGPGTPKRRLDPQDRLVTHTESWILMRLEDHVQAGDIITILGTRDPCTPANGCYNKMRDFAEDHHVEIIYVNTTQPGREWRFRPKGCAR